MTTGPVRCDLECSCRKMVHETKLVVLTGGPGAGKTAVLEMIKKMLCEHVTILPEAASILFGGGFWRMDSITARIAAQKSIFHIQKNLEELVLTEKKWSLGLCDRGTLDGLAYWPVDPESFWMTLGTTLATEYSRYQAVIHLRSPGELHGYNHQNPLRIETATEAQVIDERIHEIWRNHPKYREIPSAPNFLEKAQSAIQMISQELPDCCQKSIALHAEEKRK